jgi:DNA mismatch repair protein MutS
VILDEIGRGTSTYDGLSLAWSISEYIAKKIKCRTLFATHYHEITEMANMFTNVKNEHVSVREWKDEIVFLYKIVPGRTNKSYGIHVAKLAGIPKSVLERANKILSDLESNFSREVHMQTISKSIDPKADGGQMILFNDYPETSLEPDPIIDEIIETKIETLTPIDALNFLQRLKQNIESR